MNIAMIGSGYVGLVTGACFADLGYSVCCVDSDAAKIAAIEAGRMPIFEPGLEALVAKNAGAGRLTFSTRLAEAAARADVVFIAVGTPPRRSDGQADLRFVLRVAQEIAGAIGRYTVVAVKSTVPVGTGDDVERAIRKMVPAERFSVVSNPEFLREGSAIEEFNNPDRVVVGVEDERARALMQQLYQPLTHKRAPVMLTDRRTSELIKYASNAFLATKITFINEIADLCERVGADVQGVARGIGMDQRIGPRFLNAGPGFGGSCLPKDTLALLHTANDHAVPLRIVDAVVQINEQRKRAMGRKVIAACGGSVVDATIAVLGLTFKPDTDDMREAPSIDIVQFLQDAGARVRCYDPEGMANARQVIEDAEYADDAWSCIDGADAMVLVTEWGQFRSLDPGEIRRRLKRPIVVDLRNVYRPEEMRAAGLTYVGIGRKAGGPG